MTTPKQLFLAQLEASARHLEEAAARSLAALTPKERAIVERNVARRRLPPLILDRDLLLAKSPPPERDEKPERDDE